MKRLNLFFYLLLIGLSFHQEANAQVPFGQTGMKSFADWSPDNTGKRVVTSQLREAIRWCYNNKKTLYIPPGTYLIDNRFTCYGQEGPGSAANDVKNTFIYGDAYDRPVIKLKDGTYMGNKAYDGGVPIFELLNETPGAENKSSVKFFSTIQNLNFDLGNNTAAVAIRWRAAQDATLRNIKVFGRNFHAGIDGFPGRNSGNVNIEIIGGKYGAVVIGSIGEVLYLFRQKIGQQG